MNLPTPSDWYTALAALDSFYLAIWMIAALLIALYLLIEHAFNLKPPKLGLDWLNHHYFWHLLWTMAFLLRVPRYFTSFWYDETFTGVMARLPLDRFFEALKGDVHPPLHYIIAKASIFLLGDSDFALRFPSLIAGLALIYVMYRLALSITQDERVARLTALLVALLSAMIHYSGEARYPILLALAICTAWLALLEDEPICFVLAGSATGLLHATGVIYTAILLLMALYIGHNHKRLWKSLEWTISIMLVTVLVGCYGVFVITQSSDISNGFWLWAMLPTWHVAEGLVMMPSPELMIPIYLGVVILFIAGSLAMFRFMRTRTIWIALAIFPPLTLFVLGLLWHPVYLPRALLASSIIPLIGWSWLAVHSKRKGLYQLLIAFTVICSLFSYIYQMIQQSDDMTFDKAFAMCNESEYIYTTSTNMSIASLYYHPERSLAFIDGNNQHQELPLKARQAMGFDFMPPEIVFRDLCTVVNWNYYTTQDEIDRIAQLKELYPYTNEYLELDAFGFYEVIHFHD